MFSSLVIMCCRDFAFWSKLCSVVYVPCTTTSISSFSFKIFLLCFCWKHFVGLWIRYLMFLVGCFHSAPDVCPWLFGERKFLDLMFCCERCIHFSVIFLRSEILSSISCIFLVKLASVVLVPAPNFSLPGFPRFGIDLLILFPLSSLEWICSFLPTVCVWLDFLNTFI